MNNDDRLLNQLRNFISRYIHSAGILEVLLLIKKGSEKFWTAEEVNQELRSNASYAQSLLDQLSAFGFLESSKKEGVDIYRYKAPNSELNQLVELLVSQYGERKFAIINMIYSRPAEKILALTDAFKFKKE